MASKMLCHGKDCGKYVDDMTIKRVYDGDKPIMLCPSCAREYQASKMPEANTTQDHYR